MTELHFTLLYCLVTEVALLILFPLIARWLDTRRPAKKIVVTSEEKDQDQESTDEIKETLVKRNKVTLTSWLKGFIERIFVVFLLLAGFEGAAIILFGAVKLGTRLDQDKGNKVSNDYFLIGNFISIAAAVVIYLLLKDVVSFE